jgi:hypothetical protein
MRLIGAWSHAIIDYLLVIFLFIGPSVAGFSGRQATMCYVLAWTLLVLALLTRYPLGALKALRFPLHGAVELLLAAMLLILPWLADFARGIKSRNFFVLIGLVMLIIWFMTDFRGIRERVVDRAAAPGREGPSPPR